MNEQKAISLWVTQSVRPEEEAVFLRQHPVWLHLSGEQLENAWKIQLYIESAKKPGSKSDYDKIPLHLFHVRKGRYLIGNDSLASQEIQDGDVMVLIASSDNVALQGIAQMIIDNDLFPKRLVGVAKGKTNLTFEEACAFEEACDLFSPSEYYISYACNDSSNDAESVERIIHELCISAEKQGIKVLRDKSEIKLGDSISAFMKDIGKGGRIFVILSDKYLKSPYCMYELFEIWRNCRQERDELLNRCRVFVLEDAKILDVDGRLSYAKYWKDKYNKLDQELKSTGSEIIGGQDFSQFKLMHQFANNVGDILAAFADIHQPRTLEELKKYGFDDM